MRLWQKFCDSHVKFARNSYEFRTNFTFSEYSHISIHVNFVRIAYEFRANLCEFLFIACESQWRESPTPRLARLDLTAPHRSFGRSLGGPEPGHLVVG